MLAPSRTLPTVSSYATDTLSVPKHQVVMFRCGDDGLSAKGKSQEDLASREKAVSCGRLLDYRKHSCRRICHTGAYASCIEGRYIDRWTGRFRCELTCDR